MLTRCWVKEALRARGHKVSELALDEDVANVGLHLRVGQYDIRVWKSKEGDLPYPGRSRNKHAFLNHNQVLQAAFDFGDPWLSANLVILWTARIKRDVPDGSYALDRVLLVLPKAAPINYSASGDVYWARTLEHPALLMHPSPSDGGAQEITDLPFEFLDEETASEGKA
jgi:hypothetical protein